MSSSRDPKELSQGTVSAAMYSAVDPSWPGPIRIRPGLVALVRIRAGSQQFGHALGMLAQDRVDELRHDETNVGGADRPAKPPLDDPQGPDAGE